MFTSDTCLSRDNELPFLGSSENSESRRDRHRDVKTAHALIKKNAGQERDTAIIFVTVPPVSGQLARCGLIWYELYRV